MTPLMLRQLWALVEATQTTVLLSMDDGSLVQWLLRQLKQERTINHQEADALQDYIHSRLSLIRDLAQERLITSY